jgi:hypothetical protein
MWRGDETIFQRNWKTMKRPDNVARLLEVFVKEFGTSKGF